MTGRTAPLTHIWKIPGSNLSQETSSTNCFYNSPQFLQANGALGFQIMPQLLAPHFFQFTVHYISYELTLYDQICY